MPRDSTGVVTLPVGNPVVSGTAISADVQNATIADLASMIEDSLSRSGKGGMNAPMQFANGSAAAPSIAFTNDPDTGMYLNGASDLRLAIAGQWEVALAPGITTVRNLNVTEDAGIAGNLSVTGTLGVTGVATFTATPVLSAGISGIRRENLPATSQQIGGGLIVSGSNLAITDLSAEITIPAATGRPIVVNVQPGDGASLNGIYLEADGSGDRYANVYISRSIDGGAFTQIASYGVYALAGSNGLYAARPLNIGSFIDTPGAGSIKYKLRYAVSAAGATLTNYGMVVAAYEL